MNKFFTIMLISLNIGVLHAQERAKTPLVPFWAFGHWIWEDSEHKQDTVKYMLDSYLDRDIRVNAIILDSPWSTSYNDFEFDTILYPDAKSLIDYIHSKGAKVLAFYTGAINRTSHDSRIQKSSTYDYVLENDFTINSGKESYWWKGHGVHIDFTNPEAKEWWHEQLDKIYDLGIDGAKIDFAHAWFGDTIVTSKGKMTVDEFGYYFYADGFDYGLKRNKDFIAMTYAFRRGINKTPVKAGFYGPVNKSHVNWEGDYRGDWIGIKEQIVDIYKSAKHGYIAPGCEIGGYFKPASTKKQFIRYAQLGSLMPVMINGGSYGSLEHHLPWKHDEQTVAIYKKFVDLHYLISPYLFSTAVQFHFKPSSIISDCDTTQLSHLLGQDIFVQTISSDNDSITIRFPEHDKWINYWDVHELYNASTSVEKYYSIDKYPVFIRAGAIMPTLGNNDTLTFTIYPFQTTSSVLYLPIGNGTNYEEISISFSEETGKLSLISPVQKNFKFNIISFDKPKNVSSTDNWSYDAEKKLLTIHITAQDIQLEINGLKGYSSK